MNHACLMTSSVLLAILLMVNNALLRSFAQSVLLNAIYIQIHCAPTSLQNKLWSGGSLHPRHSFSGKSSHSADF